MLSTPTPSKSIYRAPAMTHSSIKEHKVDVKVKQHINVLYKDIEQKEKKLHRMNKEVQTIRNDYASQSRELKMLKNVFEKIIAEKAHVNSELNMSKQYNRKLEACLERLEDPQKMIDEISDLHNRLEVHTEELEQSNRSLKNRDDTITELQQDIEILKRTLDVKTEHESKQNNGIGKEAMRSLYFELGKRQADSHALSLSLSECNQNLNTYKAKTEELGEEIKRLSEKLDRKQSDNDILSQQSVGDKEEINSLRLKLSSTTDINRRQSFEIQELQAQLQNEKKVLEESQNDTIDIVSKISGELEKQKQEKNALLLALEAYRDGEDGNSTTNAAVINTTTHDYDNNNTRLITEMESLRSKNENLETLVTQLRNTISTMQQSSLSSSIILPMNRDASEYEFKISELSRELRESAVSMKVAIDDGKSIQEKYMQEIEKNNQFKLKINELENALAHSKESKDMISSTILDSLHKEKEKNSKLENIIQARSPPSSNNYNVVDADIFDEEHQLDTPVLVAPDPPIVTAEQPGSTAVEKESSPSSSSGIEDASPKLSMLEELRRMREELRRIEEDWRRIGCTQNG